MSGSDEADRYARNALMVADSGGTEYEAANRLPENRERHRRLAMNNPQRAALRWKAVGISEGVGTGVGGFCELVHMHGVSISASYSEGETGEQGGPLPRYG